MALLDAGYSENEKVGLAFYKMSGAKPDFRNWVKKSDAYKKAVPTERVNLLRSETARLERGMTTYHPDEDLINFSIDVTVRRLPDADADPNNVRHALQVVFSDTRDNYIPVEGGDVWVAMVVKDMEKYGFRVFSTPELTSALQKLGTVHMAKVQNIPAHVKMTLRPLSVSAKTPVQVEDIDLWPMLAEVASFSLWSRDGEVFVWGYEAPWYVSSERKDLIDLYKD